MSTNLYVFGQNTSNYYSTLCYTETFFFDYNIWGNLPHEKKNMERKVREKTGGFFLFSDFRIVARGESSSLLNI